MEGSGVCVAVLAAGESRRMGFPKLVAPFAKSTLLERAVGAALASVAERVCVVTGASHEAMAPILERIAASAEKPLDIVRNERWAEGQGSSVAAAACYGHEQGCDALVMVVADQPFVSTEVLNELVAIQRESGAPVVMCSDGAQRGNPAAFDAPLFEHLEALQGDEGARAVIRALSPEMIKTVAVGPRLLCDADTPEEFARLESEVLHG
ncbi:nucleotidyltransferase family protein [Adlercreutzia sp. R25]|uniref:Nucleotidyltransferase family protein n=1 Tax=Adlercreutzia shanghongiae TaxID=3111773 RepID=A0ABU6IXI0_9ACTN|nr:MULTISPECIES: nucleotidyltransferase family protein [unclassified Adlercreutzia]MEC4272539.1 nucleotidyltransferase family protein [Adlercreutzia sp. R25]MEC4294561.1 nucleotidyltransferase family protein [Adlercreutzia sp. R22]